MKIIEFFLQNLSITIAMSAIVILLLMLSRLAGEKFTAKCRYVVWAVVMLRLAIPIGMGEGWLIKIELPAEEAPIFAENTPAAPSDNYSSPADRIEYDYTPAPNANAQPSEVLMMPEPVIPAEKEFELPSLTEVLHALGIVYIIGAVVYAAFRLLAHFSYIRGIYRWRSLASANIYKQYRKLCADLHIKRVPALYISARADSPMLCGYIHPQIILPASITENEQIRGILHHELTHYRRGDLWMKLVCLLAEALHWFNPLVRRASRRCEQEMELACDETVLSGMSDKARVDYGRAMLDIVKKSHDKHSPLAARYIGLTTHYCPKRTAVRERFDNILDTRIKRRGLFIMALAVLLCAAAGLAVSCQVETGEVGEDETDHTELYSELQIFPHASDVALSEMSDAELTEILENTLYKNAMTILDWVYLGQGLEIDHENVSQTYSTESLNYALVENIESIDTLKNVCEVVFSAEFCEEYIYPLFFEGDSPLFVEDDGHLYFNTNTGGAAAYAPDFTRAEVISNDNNVCRIKVPMTSPGDDEGTPYTYVISVQDDYLVLDSFYFFAPDFTDDTQTDDSTASAIISANPIGGNPKFLVYEYGLTYYVQNLVDNSVVSSVLTLPEGYTDGKIVDGAAGGGSGEVILYVQTEADGSAVYIKYYFDTFTSVTEPAEVTILDDEQAKKLRESIREKYPPSASEQALALTDQFVRFVMKKTWLDAGYEVNDEDIWRTLTSITAYYDDKTHPYSTKITRTEDNMYDMMMLADAQQIAFELFGNSSWTQSSFTDENFDYDENCYINPRGLGLYTTVFGSAEMSAYEENGMVYATVHLVNSDLFEYEEQDYGYYTFVYRNEGGYLRFEGIQANEANESNESSALDEALQAYGLKPEESRYRFIKAFLTGDSATLEQMLWLEAGMGEAFGTLKFGDWSLKLDEDYQFTFYPPDEAYRPVELAVDIVESGMSTLPVGRHTIKINMDNPYYEIYLTIPTVSRNQLPPVDEQSDAYKALQTWLGVNSKLIRFGDPQTVEDMEAWCSDIGDYLGIRYNATRLEDYKTLAEICFGTTVFEPYSPLIQNDDGTYYVGGHGGSVYEMDFISETENADGSVSIVIKYYADHSGLIESELVEYILRDTGEEFNDVPVYAFEGMKVTPLSNFEPYYFIT